MAIVLQGLQQRLQFGVADHGDGRAAVIRYRVAELIVGASGAVGFDQIVGFAAGVHHFYVDGVGDLLGRHPLGEHVQALIVRSDRADRRLGGLAFVGHNGLGAAGVHDLVRDIQLEVEANLPAQGQVGGF